uniref:Uncharacterized protein n=1 Tax=Ditylenchus dipsaci TaxID=166011 RepID=A0A915CLR7_9BILA
MDVDIVLDDNDVASPPTCSISEEGVLRVRNPFVAAREHIAEDQKQANWLCAQDLEALNTIMGSIAFLDKMWQEFKKNAPTIYQPKTQRTQ